MNGNKNSFDKKYNFDLTNEIKPVQSNQKEYSDENGLNITSYIAIDKVPINDFDVNKKHIKNMMNNLYEKEEKEDLKFVIEKQSEEERKKIIADSKTYSQNLRRKVKLNYNLFSLYYQNFYLDEFNLSRKSSYMMIGLPGSVILFFSTILTNHPLFGISLNISVVASIATFIYCYKRDMDTIASDRSSEIGRKIRMIKNELVLYNPIVNPVLTEDEQNEKNYKI
jgi:hypothetical protein